MFVEQIKNEKKNQKIMKGKIFGLGLLSLTVFLLFTLSCESDLQDNDPDGYCVKDVFCNNQEVWACCTDDNGVESCVYKFNGKEYSSKEELIEALGCSTSSIVMKSAGKDVEQDDIAFRLQSLMDLAHAGLRALKEY